MKRALLLALIAFTIAALMARERVQPWLDPVLAALGLVAPPSHYLGYIEGETTLIGAPTAGRLIARAVERGDHVVAGARLFVVDPVQAEAEIARALAAVGEAEARLANLQTGKRQAEQEIVRAQRKEAAAALVFAEQDLARDTELATRGVASRARLDHGRSTVAQLKARIESLAALEVAGDLGGRDQEIAMAKAQVAQSQASLVQMRHRRDDLMPTAPHDGVVENVFFNPGEWVPAGTPIVALLAPERIKLRFFLPEPHLGLVAIGRAVRFACDGCPAGQHATISFVSPRAEFTPPLIYSESARAKLVFLVEARLTGPAGGLRPGLPVQVEALQPMTP